MNRSPVNPESVLFVDDDPMLLCSMVRCLSPRIDIQTAASGDAALAQFQKDGPFSVVVTDMRMPKMDGMELIRRLRDIESQTRFIMLTGNQDAKTVEAAKSEGGVFGFLNKPIDPDAIAEMVEAAQNEHAQITAAD